MFVHSTGNGLYLGLPEINSMIDIAAGDQIEFFTYTPSTVLREDGTRVPEQAPPFSDGTANPAEVGYLSIGVARNVETGIQTDSDIELTSGVTEGMVILAGQS